MKRIVPLLRISIPFFLLLLAAPDAQGQLLKKLKKRAERAAERTVERRVDQETSKKTDEVLDSILEPGKKGKTPTGKDGQPLPGGDNPNNTGNDGQGGPDANAGESGPESITVYSKFDFVPGDQPMFFDDLAYDFVGDFPAKWNTNGSGEVVTVNDSPEKWLEMVPGYNIYYIPDVPTLPEEYTIEFDLLAVGLDRQTSSTAILDVVLSDDSMFKRGANFVQAKLPFCQYAAIGINMENHINNKRVIYSTVRADVRDEVINRPHVSIAVNKQRYRLWINEEKHVDIPRIVPTGAVLSTLKFGINNFKDGKERLFITNLKVAKGGVDLRRKLLSEGRISTNAILFDSGSANLQPQSMGVIRQISQVLQQDGNIKLNIIGHTDSDGDDANNMSLSKKRADAVKSALVNIYNVDTNRLTTEGKGETEPVGDNGTSEGKAQNRRVEFVKI
ncbi:OmpA family protein [Poritiphilus flavus]|uniref:OmpA family protein n=1 Tax=Poritiphilus flavus TaxID=2697053 RepID=A0A6L9EIQ8_9FLAO|nr:OmpA family protein [Poritiphilus flavus]NAS14398.1 OmpA family protein [Poritiphilus flavus]